jgi:transposase
LTEVDIENLLSFLLGGLKSLALKSYELNNTNEPYAVVNLSSLGSTAICPGCQKLARKVHSRYQRKLADLPWGNSRVILKIGVKKFFCQNQECERRIFCERLEELTTPWGRKTTRLAKKLLSMGLALGGAAGASLAKAIGYSVCGSTLLNYIKKQSLPDVKEIKILGVDDFAFRRGKRYGTILVNLETHQPVGLLEDRKAETLVEWLSVHKSIEILSRDRSKTYASAMTEGAPEAMQVADRFHLVQNFAEILEKIFSRYEKELKTIEDNRQAENLDLTQKVIITPQPTATEKARAKTQANHHRRLDKQRQIKELHERGWLAEAIAPKVGVSVRTVRRFLTRPDLPAQPARRRSFGRSLLDPYKSRIIEWFNSGITDSGGLMILLKQKGYAGGIRTLQHYLSSLRQSQGIQTRQGRMRKVASLSLPPVQASRLPSMTPTPSRLSSHQKTRKPP